MKEINHALENFIKFHEDFGIFKEVLIINHKMKNKEKI